MHAPGTKKDHQPCANSGCHQPEFASKTTKICGVCHDAGVANAPKLGDKAGWAPRIAQGKDTLYKSALQGKPGTAMVAKGGFANLADADVKAVVDLMMAKAK